jgi:hypothetical protein
MEESLARLCRLGRQPSSANPRGKPGSRPSKKTAGERQTVCWREVDSNFRFRTRGAMAWPSSVASWAFFSARNCSALRARSGLTPLPAAPGHALSLAAGSRRGKRTRGDAKSARRQWSRGVYGFGGWRLALLLERLRARCLKPRGGRRRHEVSRRKSGRYLDAAPRQFAERLRQV